jgi:hypothetical protein
VYSPVVNNVDAPRLRDPEYGDPTGNQGLQIWLQVVKSVGILLNGMELGYKEFSTCRRLISNMNTASSESGF